VERHYHLVDPLLKVNLRVRKGERILVLVDDEEVYPQHVAEIALDVCRRYGPSSLVSYRKTGTPGAEPPTEVWQAAFGAELVGKLERHGLLQKLIEKEISSSEFADISRMVTENKRDPVDVVLAFSWYSVTHTKFRELLCHYGRTRFLSAPRLVPGILEKFVNSDWHGVLRKTEKLADLMSNLTVIEVSAPNGTRVELDISGRKLFLDTGMLDKQGSFGNYPGGECYVAPVEGSAKGTLVFEHAPNLRLEEPVRCEVANGVVASISGSLSYVSYLERRFLENDNNRKVCELGIGTNYLATDPVNIRESEKILGTVHVALGDNSAMGGTISTPFHEDYVLFSPTVIAEDLEHSSKCLIENGIPQF